MTNYAQGGICNEPFISPPINRGTIYGRTARINKEIVQAIECGIDPKAIIHPNPITTNLLQIGDIQFIRKPTPTKIIRSNNATIVFWSDDTKTVVKRSPTTPDDPYNAFCAALGIKLYGTNSALKRAIREAGGLPDAVKEDSQYPTVEIVRKNERISKISKISKIYIDGNLLRGVHNVEIKTAASGDELVYITLTIATDRDNVKIVKED